MGKRRTLVLRDGDREELERIVRKPTSENRVVRRARMLLLLAEGLSANEVATRVGVSHAVPNTWADRYEELGMIGIVDAPRPGRPSTISDAKIGDVVRATIEEKPAGATHWSSRDLARRMGLNQTRITRIWRTFGLKPHLSESFQLSTDPEFVEKLRDVIGVYLNPPTTAAVFCVDEKTQIQALNRRQAILPTRPGMVEARTPEYRRHGTTDLFAALNVASSKVLARCYQKHRSAEFIDFLEQLSDTVPADNDIHVILDNSSIHKSQAVKRFQVKNPRFVFHFIPTHSSWLNLVEAWFSLLTAKQLSRGAHTSVPQLQQAIYAYRDAYNDDPKPFKWTRTADDVLLRLANRCDAILTAHTDRSDRN
jgi:transposase